MMMMMIVIHLKTKMIMIIIHLQTSEYTFVNQYDNGDCATSWFFYCSSLNEKKPAHPTFFLQTKTLLFGWNSFFSFRYWKSRRTIKCILNTCKSSGEQGLTCKLLANCVVIVCVFQNVCIFVDIIFVCLFVGKIKRPPL